jgi:hypothetical protein
LRLPFQLVFPAFRLGLSNWLSDICAKGHLCEVGLREREERREKREREREERRERWLYWQPFLT